MQTLNQKSISKIVIGYIFFLSILTPLLYENLTILLPNLLSYWLLGFSSFLIGYPFLKTIKYITFFPIIAIISILGVIAGFPIYVIMIYANYFMIAFYFLQKRFDFNIALALTLLLLKFTSEIWELGIILSTRGLAYNFILLIIPAFYLYQFRVLERTNYLILFLIPIVLTISTYFYPQNFFLGIITRIVWISIFIFQLLILHTSRNIRKVNFNCA